LRPKPEARTGEDQRVQSQEYTRDLPGERQTGWDVYDAMINDRPYRKVLTHEEALAELEAGAGS
jgi:hypothetical protein